MAKPPHILLLTDDNLRREKWRQMLPDPAEISPDPGTLHSATLDVPDLIITDHLPITAPLGLAATPLACGEIAVVAVGAAGLADVVLPADCTPRELRLACRLLVEVVRLRRRLGEEIRTQKALRTMAYRDPLTGVANRRKWERELTARLEGAGSAGAGSTMAIVLLDLDHFKPINDRLGHVAGDMVLRRVAQRLAANVSQPHFVARLGGDEFGVLLSGVMASEARDVAETIRRSLEHRPELGSEDEPPITASAGVVVVEIPAAIRPLQALTAADLALRNAKSQGRSRTVEGGLSPEDSPNS